MDPVPRSSSLEFYRGSHLHGIEYAPVKIGDGSPYADSGAMPPIPSPIPPTDILQWELAVGDCLVFDSRIVHAAPAVSASAPRRRAFATRWSGTDARYEVATKCSETQSSGYPNFDCGLKEGDAMTCKAFPLVWPREHIAMTGYRGLEAERAAEVLTLQPSTDYANLRRAQSAIYSTGIAV